MDRTKFKYCHFCGKELIVKEKIFNPVSGEVVKRVITCPDWQEPKKVPWLFPFIYELEPSNHAIYTFDLEEIIKSNG